MRLYFDIAAIIGGTLAGFIILFGFVPALMSAPSTLQNIFGLVLIVAIVSFLAVMAVTLYRKYLK